MSSDNVAGMLTQHKLLDERISTVCSTLKNPCDIDDLKDKLDDLVRFLQTHCAEEENLMRRYRYDGLKMHERAHQNLLKKLLSLREKIFVSFNDENKKALMEFFEVDFMQHVTEDMKAWQEGEIERAFVYRRLADPAHNDSHGH